MKNILKSLNVDDELLKLLQQLESDATSVALHCPLLLGPSTASCVLAEAESRQKHRLDASHCLWKSETVTLSDFAFTFRATWLRLRPAISPSHLLVQELKVKYSHLHHDSP